MSSSSCELEPRSCPLTAKTLGAAAPEDMKKQSKSEWSMAAVWGGDLAETPREPPVRPARPCMLWHWIPSRPPKLETNTLFLLSQDRGPFLASPLIYCPKQVSLRHYDCYFCLALLPRAPKDTKFSREKHVAGQLNGYFQCTTSGKASLDITDCATPKPHSIKSSDFSVCGLWV